MFRDYGEQYIGIYKPSLQQIKLIRALRVCRTPALGGFVYSCKSCGKNHYVYKSCGHSHCMLCQSIKREQWLDKLKTTLLKVPYVHSVFTLPHQLNSLAKWNEKVMYGLIMKVAWLTIKETTRKYGAYPGMTGVLHTFGSDMKYHIHVHCLVTFGGLGKNGDWMYPPHKKLLANYRVMCATYKSIFLAHLHRLHIKGALNYPHNFDELMDRVAKLRWVVHTTYPTMNTDILENYLARYINRIAITNNRLHYIQNTHKVNLIYNDYKQQKSGEIAPKAIKTMEPLVAINQILQHVLPRYFQKSRRHGLHNASTKVRNELPQKLKRQTNTIRTLFQIITQLTKLTRFECENCKSTDFTTSILLPSYHVISNFISSDSLKSPPSISENRGAITPSVTKTALIHISLQENISDSLVDIAF